MSKTDPDSSTEPSADGPKHRFTGQRDSVGLRGGVVPFDSSQVGLLTETGDDQDDIPDRYDVRERDSGPALVCREAPGIAVHIANRVAATADAGAVFVSEPVRIAVTGSGIDFQDEGEHALKGVPGSWRLHSAIV